MLLPQSVWGDGDRESVTVSLSTFRLWCPICETDALIFRSNQHDFHCCSVWMTPLSSTGKFQPLSVSDLIITAGLSLTGGQTSGFGPKRDYNLLLTWTMTAFYKALCSIVKKRAFDNSRRVKLFHPHFKSLFLYSFQLIVCSNPQQVFAVCVFNVFTLFMVFTTGFSPLFVLFH